MSKNIFLACFSSYAVVQTLAIFSELLNQKFGALKFVEKAKAHYC